MVWQQEVDELDYRRRLALQMGGEEAIARHHARGKLTVRERIAALADPESFQEIGSLAGTANYDGDKLVSFMPENYVIGTCTVGGRRVVVIGGDFTIRGGAGIAGPEDKPHCIANVALNWHLPYIQLLDAAGGSVRGIEQLGRPIFPLKASGVWARLLTTVPVVSVVLGSVAGAPAVYSCMSHFNVMVRNTSQVFVAGPPVVKAALWEDITKETLGGEKVQAHESGVICNVADSEEEAFAIVRQFLSYMPDSVWEIPPRVEPNDDPNRRDEELLSIIPREKNRQYNAREILNHVCDHNSFFEIAPFYGRSRITGLARVNGYPVGVMINNPMHRGGSMDVAAANKIIRLLELCDTFHLPMVYFVDEPGFMVGLESEKEGMVRLGARVSFITGQTKMPWISFIVRQVFGVAGACYIREEGTCKLYAWPSGNWGAMHIEGGVMAAYRRDIETAPDPDAKRREIEGRLKAITSPFRSAEAFEVDIIDPRDTRPLLCDFVESAQRILKMQLGPSIGPSYRP